MCVGVTMFLPFNTDDTVSESRMPYKIRMVWDPRSYSWLCEQMPHGTAWCSRGDVKMQDEIYYFAQEADAVRFWLTWS